MCVQTSQHLNTKNPYYNTTMSYNHHYESGSGGGQHGGGRERDRARQPDRPDRGGPSGDRDRANSERAPYYSRYNNNPKRYGPPQGYGDGHEGSSYRRQDNREYYGYRGGFGRGNGNDRNQLPNGSNQGQPRRRPPTDKYDLYQGSKYRPAASKNKLSLQNSNGQGSSSRGHSSQEHSSHYSGLQRLLQPRRLSDGFKDGRTDARDEPGHEFNDHRRQRKNEWDQSNYHRNRSQPRRASQLGRDHYQPDNKDKLRVEHQSSEALKDLKSPAPTELDRLSSEPKRALLVAKDEPSSPKPTPADSPIKANPTEDVKENEPVTAEPTGDLPSEPKDEVMAKPEPEPKPAADADTEMKEPEDSPVKSEKQPTTPLPDSPAATINTSVLSPVRSPTADETLTQAIGSITADDHDISDAETIADTTISMEVSRKFLRKGANDEERRKLKRKVIYSSDDEDDDAETNDQPEDKEEEADYLPSEPTVSSSAIDETKSETKDVDMMESSFNDTINNSKEEDDDLDADNSQSDDDGAEDEDLSDTDDMMEEKSSSPASTGEPREKLSTKKGSTGQKTYKIKRDSTGRSQLQRACKKGDLDEVKRLVARGANVNESDFGGFTCLHEAALVGNTEIVKFLILQGADVNKQALEAGDSETPLMDAAENKHIETVKVLLENGADPHICNVDGYSALTKLYQLQSEDEDYMDVIKLFDSSTLGENTSILTTNQQSPRKVIEDPTESYFNDLVKRKSNPMIYKYAAQGLAESTAEDFITHAYSLLNMPDILNLAARNGYVDLVDILLGLNPGLFDINQKNKVGVTPLLATVGRGYYEVVKFLLSKGADPKIKREKDGLNALQAAKHSAQHDPREVFFLEQSIRGENLSKIKSKNATVKTSTGTQDQHGKSTEVTHKKSNPFQADETNKPKLSEGTSPNWKPAELGHKQNASQESTQKRRLSEDTSTKRRMSGGDEYEKKLKKAKSSEPENGRSSHHKHVQFSEEVHKNGGENSPDPESLDVKEKKIKEEYEDETPEPDSGSELKKLKKKSTASVSPGPAPLTKAQEEQRIKAAEQAKIWQEKVQAKKKARKEMFLQAEREKERKRKEDEQRKIEEEKLQQQKEKAKKLKEAEEVEKMAEKVQSKMLAMEIRYTLERYPIGLQEAVFDGSLTSDDRLKYAPLYVFLVDGESWVVDLQVALLLSTPVQEIHSKCGSPTTVDISNDTKAQIWPLFFSMIGVSKDFRVDKDGLQKFQYLHMRYVRLADVKAFIEKSYPDIFDSIWREKRLTKVNLQSFGAPNESALPAPARPREEHPVDAVFVPPKWKQRPDVLHTIKTANIPLW